MKGFSDFQQLSRVGLVPHIAGGHFYPELQNRHSDSISLARIFHKLRRERW